MATTPTISESGDSRVAPSARIGQVWTGPQRLEFMLAATLSGAFWGWYAMTPWVFLGLALSGFVGAVFDKGPPRVPGRLFMWAIWFNVGGTFAAIQMGIRYRFP